MLPQLKDAGTDRPTILQEQFFDSNYFIYIFKPKTLGEGQPHSEFWMELPLNVIKQPFWHLSGCQSD